MIGIVLNLQITGENYIPIVLSLWTSEVSIHSVLPWFLQVIIYGCLCLGLLHLPSKLSISISLPYTIVKNIYLLYFLIASYKYIPYPEIMLNSYDF